MLVRGSRGIVALVVMTLAACGGGSIFGPRSGLALHLARARWQNSGVGSYELTVGRSCECLVVGAVRVRVENGVVVSRTVVSTGAPLAAEHASYYPDVPGLFAIIEHARANGADDLDTDFDGTYGFPTVISIDWYVEGVDDELFYRAEAFVVVP